MKSGTTSLFSYLKEHPQIAESREKEPCFFSREDIFAKGYNWYYALWDWDNSIHEFAMEGSTSYTRIPTYANAAENIKKFTQDTGANAKFIYVVRDPIQRIESHYTYAKALRHKEYFKVTDQPLHSDFLAPSRYAYQIRQYYERFPPSNILIVDLKRLKEQRAEVLKEICVFLDIDGSYQFLGADKEINSNQGRIENDALWLRLKKNQFLHPVAKKIPKQYKQLIHGLYGQKIRGNIPLTEEARLFAKEQLKEDIALFESEYGFDIASWKLD